MQRTPDWKSKSMDGRGAGGAVGAVGQLTALVNFEQIKRASPVYMTMWASCLRGASGKTLFVQDIINLYV